MLNILCPLPRVLVFEVWIDELRCLTEPTTIGKLERQWIGCKPLEGLAKSSQDVKVEDRIAVRLGARQFPRKRSIHGHLIGQQNLPVAPVHLFACRLIASKTRELSSL